MLYMPQLEPGSPGPQTPTIGKSDSQEQKLREEMRHSLTRGGSDKFLLKTRFRKPSGSGGALDVNHILLTFMSNQP